jgi:guanosine-3',5'-bis(diphosphate) 3'-pyrophosphohydrolase
MQLTFNTFISTTKNLLEKNGYDLNKIKIYSAELNITIQFI